MNLSIELRCVLYCLYFWSVGGINTITLSFFLSPFVPPPWFQILTLFVVIAIISVPLIVSVCKKDKYANQFYTLPISW